MERRVAANIAKLPELLRPTNETAKYQLTL
jgi:hypothetical protein